VDECLAQRGKVSTASSVEEDRVSPQALGHPRDRGLCAMTRSCDLAVS
jgi:hypothetical protein